MQLHIGFFQAGYPVPDGTTTAVHGLANGLALAGHQVTIYGCGRPTADSVSHSHPNVTERLYPSEFRKPFQVPRELLDRLRENQERLDLLIINTMFNPPNRAVARAARRGNIPYVISPHDPYHPKLLEKNRWRKFLYAALVERPLLRRAAAVQILSAAHDRFLRQFGYNGLTVVVPNGFDAASLPEPTHAKLDLAGDPSFLFLGRLDVDHKGLDLLVRAFARAARLGAIPPSAALNFVGPDKGDRVLLERIAAEESVSNRLKFFGRVSNEERWAALRSASLLFLPSRYDGFGLVALEAMLSAKPVVVSREAGIAAWVEEAQCGFLAEPDVHSLAEAWERAMKARPAWAEYGERGALMLTRT